MAINNRNPASSTPTDLPFPIHRLNRPQNALWFINPRGIASQLIAMYPGGVGVLSWSQHLFALVQPRGVIVPLPQPHRRYEMWQIANAPRPDECPCADFIDPEVQGEWRQRGEGKGHHPLCQFDRTAVPVFLTAQKMAVDRMQKGASAQERPDEWLRLQKTIANR